MSNATLKYEIIGEDKNASATFKKVSTAADETHGHMGKLATIMAGVFGGAALFEGASKAVDFLKESVGAAVEDQRAETLLTQTLHNVAGATDEQTEAVKRRLLADGESLGIMQDQMMPAYQKLLMATHSIKTATSDLTLTENIAAAKHISLADAAGLVAKMTMGGNKAFKEFGVTVVSNSSALAAVQKAQMNLAFTQKQVNDGALTGKKAITALTSAHTALTKAQYMATASTKSVQDGMAKVSAIVRGDAVKAADTYSGRLAQMHVRFHDLQVRIGNGVLPMLTQLSGWILNKAVPAFESMAKFVQQNTQWLLPLAAGIAGVIAAVKLWAFWQSVLDVELEANPIGAVVMAIAAFVAAVILAYNKVAWFRDFVNAAFKVISTIVLTVVNLIKDHWQQMLAVLTLGVSNIVIFIVQHWKQISDVFGSVTGWIKAAWGGTMSFFTSKLGTIGHVFGSVINAIKAPFSTAFNWVKSAFQAVITFIQNAINALKNSLPSLSNPLGALNPVSGYGGMTKGAVHQAWINAGRPGPDPSLKMARGGIVMPRAGGTHAILAEAGQAEAVLPLNRLGSLIGRGSGGDMIVNVTVNGFVGNDMDIAGKVKQAMAQRARTSGNAQAQAIFGGAW